MSGKGAERLLALPGETDETALVGDVANDELMLMVVTCVHSEFAMTLSRGACVAYDEDRASRCIQDVRCTTGG